MTPLKRLYWNFVMSRTRVGWLPSVAGLGTILLYAGIRFVLWLDLHGAVEQCVLLALAIPAALTAAAFVVFREGLLLSVGRWPGVLEVHAGRSFFVSRDKNEALTALYAVIRDARASGVRIVTLETPLFARKAVLDRYARTISRAATEHVETYRTSIQYASWYTVLSFMAPRLPALRKYSKIKERRSRLTWDGWRLSCGRMELRLRPQP